MNRLLRWAFGIATLATLSATDMVANANDRAEKSIGSEDKTYVRNPEPVLQANPGEKEKLSLKKDSVLKKIKLTEKQKILSTKLKTWKEYKTTEGDGSQNFEVADDRMVWEVKIDAPDGVRTRGGYYRNATQIFVIDADTEKLIEMRVHGDRYPASDQD